MIRIISFAYGVVFSLIALTVLIPVVSDKVVIPFILWLHKKGILRAKR